ncbi:hypothetical protein TREMEDRAFT_37629 [Tremella mesenterica DSM 1558]|uniref:uncharacterized protein n=1 Tax=Tremella mesenterica (strain ATCC 24925 / CBS 8224 / DSM 1558 / NBRC 9311 / NRRL Y-6157 / RJB 2259-6 / UBC 559-6) TaxID=578456 RepID=UPI0003F495D9|nr:uncharacterized protein TREMEDRAFT_37629 [Tremella mesenterica DSM 1558]EIW71201.1 hypothetical protein TREMEDRAFT_37629 [Tremella mesenterica DSM 1558]
MKHPDKGIRLLAIHCLSRQEGWSEEKRKRMERRWVGEVDQDVEIIYDAEIAPCEKGVFEVKWRIVDGWLLPLLESQRLEDYRRRRSNVAFDYLPLPVLEPRYLSPHTVVVASTFFLRNTSTLNASLPPPVPHVTTPSSEACKTHLVQYLSSQLHPTIYPTNRILTIPLADTSIDVKSLIGTYISSRTRPGTFEWMQGALTKALQAGSWVVFDDIDKASTEMLVTISTLARTLQHRGPGQRAYLDIPGRGKIQAGHGFAMFATRTLRQGAYTPPTFLGKHNYLEVILESPDEDEILEILNTSFPRIPTSLATTLVKAWNGLRHLAGGSKTKSREIGLRDLEKWCARVSRSLPSSGLVLENPLGNPALQQAITMEAIDTFVAALDTKPLSLDRRQEMTSVIATVLGLDVETAATLISSRYPTLEVASSSRSLFLGRASLPITHTTSSRRQIQSSRPFALTRPSLVLLERIACAVNMAEPILLVGETGTGKTTAVQYIATTCNRLLTVLNLSMQTESSDLLGGFKPVDATAAARSIHVQWQTLFCDTFSAGKSENAKYLELVSKALSGRKWERCVGLWKNSTERAIAKLCKRNDVSLLESGGMTKKRKMNGVVAAEELLKRWESCKMVTEEFELQHVKMQSKLVFTFLEGPLVKALQNGEWLLLDEINLASQETLEAIATILEGTYSSLVLTERGDVEPVPRHPDFRLFACMNPATDVGKKDLPPNLRSRFTEFYVPPPDDDRDALTAIVSQYISDVAAGDQSVILDIVELYTELKRLSDTREIVDGSNVPPHFSMRTLTRALSFAVETAPVFGLRRGLWEGSLMSFTMSLDYDSSQRACKVCEQYILIPMKNARAVLSQIPSLPHSADSDDFVRFGPYWLKRGPEVPSDESRYIITPSVQSKLADLARVIMTHKYPVLIQGPTSSGKTSAVEYLARQTGHIFVRINNHEHTDIQEYLGTYVTDPRTGSLSFQEGLLVTAVRQGHWLVLDELNLAPTDVLEALNRLLDDNRELVIPETQEVVKPHPNFILFATQNPPGLYAGRKVLSRAFRNRFLEVHFDDVPKEELEIILCQRCQIAPSYAKKIVQVFEELRHRRQASRVFESKSSFATLRDLFRWAERGAVGYQQLAEDGYMLLAERARQDEDKAVIKQVIEDIMKVTIDEHRLYRLFDQPTESILSRLPFTSVPNSSLVWTKAMQRLFGLIAFALAHNEPVLLVGETGSGKTSVCDIIAQAFGQQMIGVNCHQNMETADLLGSQRPVRNRIERKAKLVHTLSQWIPLPLDAGEDEILSACDQLSKRPDVPQDILTSCQVELKQLLALFEWSDGPLVHAMRSGDLLLLDEVSLADDSVLERLNSVLEPGRTLVLAERGGTDIDAATLVAHPGFHVVATMNPGGDFGKKELSPALRNRFTEIWVPALNDSQDLLQIINASWKYNELRIWSEPVLDFFEWFKVRLGDGGLGLRDILAWVGFMNEVHGKGLMDPPTAYMHGGQMVFVDGLESLPQVSGFTSLAISTLRQECLNQLCIYLPRHDEEVSPKEAPTLETTDLEVKLGGFGIPRGLIPTETSHFKFEAPTTALNAMRVLRGCQLPKAILLEGSPGVGKTSLVSALASISSHKLHRINLSDQTDLIDLFGSDLPVEGGSAGEFQWRDAAFLDALQKGDWVLLDEMNLASQTVLEGLNAVLDHRGTVYIPELGRSFVRHKDFRVFAAQNPLQQGGGRKGLPKSFLNRFTKVYLQEHTSEDLLLICQDLHPSLSTEMVQRMITFNEIIREKTMVSKTIGRFGSPWEFNLRDLFRWFNLLSQSNGLEVSNHPMEFLPLVYLQRFRSESDRKAVSEIFEDTFNLKLDFIRPTPMITSTYFQLGHSIIRRSTCTKMEGSIKYGHLEMAESVLKCVEMGWLVILSGEAASGKRSLLRYLASGAGRELGEFAMHPGVDTSELLGSFEQQDSERALYIARRELDAVRRQVDSFGFDQVLDDIRSKVKTIASHVDLTSLYSAFDVLKTAASQKTGFAWIDGPLLTAIRSGGWFLISSANLCSPSVLDRLNSLCETNGVLVLSEKGSSTGTPETVKPHPDFRLFMTYDPTHGELSRAMRNRGVELFVERVDEDMVRTTGACSEGDSFDLALEDDTILRRLKIYDDTGETTSAKIANVVVSQTWSAKSFIPRFGKIHTQPAKELYDIASTFLALSAQPDLQLHDDDPSQGLIEIMPIDPSLNPNLLKVKLGTFNELLLYLRNESRHRQLLTWIQDPINSQSIISISAHNQQRSRNKPNAANALWSLINSFRSNLAEILTAPPSTIMSELERLHVFVYLLEKYGQINTFDYSATQILARWMREIISQVPVLSTQSDNLDELAKAVEITTGLGQNVIWSLYRDSENRDIEPELMKIIERVEDPTDKSGIRRNIVDLLVTDREGTHEELTHLLESLPQVIEESETKWNNRAVLHIIELANLQFPQQMEILLTMDKDVPMDVLLDLRRLNISGYRVEPAVAIRAVTSWLGRVWKDGGGQGGPTDLFMPSFLGFCRKETSLPLSDLLREQQSLNFTIQAVLWHNKQADPFTRRRQAINMALGLLHITCLAFEPSVVSTHLPSQIIDVLHHLPSTSILHDSLQQHLPFLGSLTHMTNLSLDVIGTLYLILGQITLHLYVPNVPIDPAVERVMQEEVLLVHLDLVEEELEAVQAAEVAIRGISDSLRVRRIQEKIENLRADLQNLGPTIARQSNALRISQLFTEVYSFLADSLNSRVLQDLVDALQHGDTHALQRENAFQLSAEAVIRRLQVNYYDMADLTAPLISALLLIQFGLRCHAREHEFKMANPSPLLPLVIQFPTISGAREVVDNSVTLYNDSSLRGNLLVASAQASEFASSGRHRNRLAVLVSSLNDIYHTWSDVRLREQEEAQVSESLYRVKKTEIDVLPDDEQEEEEFARLFPSYAEDDEDTRHSQTVTETTKEKKDISGKFLPDDVVIFHQLVISVTSPSASIPFELFLSGRDQLLTDSFDPATLNETLDFQSSILQLSQLHSRVQEASSHAIGNFYLSPNEPTSVIAEWPEQMVPQHIRDRCLLFLQLDIRSPVAQVLAALEQLLTHTDDWEAYANRENSLQVFRDKATALIIEWRRLELASWMRLLEDQAEEYIRSDAEWSLRLFGALVHGVISTDNLDKHVESLLPMLGTYLSSSTLGHFESRLIALKAFEELTDGLGISDDRLKRVSILLHNVIAEASLYSPRVKESLQQQRSVLDKSIRDFVKLASWKDVNVYALRASAQRTHRQLHRAIRKFRDILRQPVSPLLADSTPFTSQEQPVSLSFPASTDLQPSATISSEVIIARMKSEVVIPDTLRQIQITFDRYSAIHHSFILAQSSNTATEVDSFAVEIIETAAMLAKATPSTLTKENAKLVKNLASRKRKAFSDLLSALRESGFSNNVRADQLKKQQDRIWLMERPSLLEVGDVERIRKVESYHHRQAVLMSTLRAAFNGHNPDIASQDLQRGIGFVESVYATALTERDSRLARYLSQMSTLAQKTVRLRQCSEAAEVTGGREVLQQMNKTLNVLCGVRDGLHEAMDMIRKIRDLQHRPVTGGDTSLVSKLLTATEECVAAMSMIVNVVEGTGCLLFTTDEVNQLQTAQTLLLERIPELLQEAERKPEFHHLFTPLVSMARVDRWTPTQFQPTKALSTEIWQANDQLIQRLLVVAQRLDTATSPALDDDTRVKITDDLFSQRKSIDSLHVTQIFESIDSVLSNLTDEMAMDSSRITPHFLGRLLPFLEVFSQSLTKCVTTHLHTVQATYKLSYVIARIMLDLAQKGFCKPTEADDSADGAEGDTVDGTGMGSGTGDKNVSAEIEEESQVEGLQGEEEDGEQEKKQGDDDAVSMDEDFEGALEDGKEKEEEGSGEEEEEEHDEHAGDVDPLDPGAVDEKFWGEEKEEGGKDSDEKMNEQTDDQGEEGEMTAKEKDTKQGKDEKKKGIEEQDNKYDDTQHEEEQEGDDMHDEDHDMEAEEESEGQQQETSQDQVDVDQGQNLKLPDDLDLGEEGDEKTPDTEDDLPLPPDADEESQHDMEEEQGRNEDMDDDEEAGDDAPDATGIGEEDRMEQDENPNQNLDLSASNTEAQETDLGQGQSGGQRQKEQFEQNPEVDQEKEVGETENEQVERGDGPAPPQQGQGTSTVQQDEPDGPVDSSGAPIPANGDARQDQRTPGDILQDIRRRRDEILAQRERAQMADEQPSAAEEAPGQVEYLKEGDVDEEMQALGPAGEEERRKLEDLNIVDDEVEGDGQMGMDNTEERDDAFGPPPTKQADVSAKREPRVGEEGMEKALTQSEIQGRAEVNPESGDTMEVDSSIEDDTPQVADWQGPEQVELSILDPNDTSTKESDADLWRHYASLTSDLSYALCEQLRLILAPTLATRLQGDFRTGKRLNMRKIIPYIASEYTKDKIWLRRTRPSRREYQVLLALDDSRSMSESHSVDLAYQTLALVCQALNKLEVGQVSVARFGAGVDILHPFSEGAFTDGAGTTIVNSFKFDQQKTDVALLVERTLGYLAESRTNQTSSTGMDLWQLEIIISDGICQDHHRLRTLLRRAIEERVMIVFIIVDSLHRQSTSDTSGGGNTSILSMQSVEYKTNKEGGMELDMKRYLDTFPFEFYVVLRDVEALPGVLADTLRQWMTRVSQSQE